MKVTEFGLAVVEGDTHLAPVVELSKRLDIHRGWLESYQKHIPVGGLVCDIGACIGHHSASYSKFVGETGVVHAYEPNPVALQCLKYNMSKFGNVVIHGKAVGDKTSTVSIESNPNVGMAHVNCAPGQIEMARLDDEATGWSRLDFLKIDVEGYEVEVINGGLETIKRFRPVMLIEVNEPLLKRYGRTPKQVHSLLDELGYDYSPVRPGETLETAEIDLICVPKPKPNPSYENHQMHSRNNSHALLAAGSRQ